MRACHDCLHWAVCSVREDDIACGIYKPKEKRNVKPQTHADRIRAMSDAALAELLLDGCRGSTCGDQSHNDYGSVDCFKCRMDWLKQPEKDGEDE